MLAGVKDTYRDALFLGANMAEFLFRTYACTYITVKVPHAGTNNSRGKPLSDIGEPHDT